MDAGIAMLDARQHWLRASVQYGSDHPITVKYYMIYRLRRALWWNVRTPQPQPRNADRYRQDNWN